MSDVADSINVILKQRGGAMVDYKQELWDDLDQLRDYACTMKRAATDMLDWIHVIENDMQSFIEEYTGPAFMPPKPGAEQSFEPKPGSNLLPMEQEFLPGSPCIDPEGEGCKCYVGCTADCLPSEYKACKCPRKISNMLDDEMVIDLKPQSDPTEFDAPFVPGSPCIYPDGLGGICNKGCTATCLSTEYQECQCPRKVELDPEDDEPYYTLTEKGELIVKLINQGYKYLEACKIAATVYDKKE